MSDLRELYQQIILDHNKNPKNFKIVEPHTHFAEGYNPLCGDRIDVYLKVENGRVVDIGFQGSGCAISKASASVMTTIVKGKSVQEAQEIFEKFQKLITGELDAKSHLEELGKLAIFEGVKQFPTRVKCATLAWHTLIAALQGKKEEVSTE